jgi:beta-glucanase (GH16 family)
MAMWRTKSWEGMPEEMDDLLHLESANQDLLLLESANPTPLTHGRGHFRMLALATGFVAVAAVGALVFAGSSGSGNTYLRHDPVEGLLGMAEVSQAPPPTECVDDGQNCIHVGCCKRSEHKCYMKDLDEAFCKASSPAGWLGHELISRQEPISEPVPAPLPTECVDDGQNCIHVGCCKRSEHKCYMKDLDEAFCTANIPAGWLGHELMGRREPISEPTPVPVPAPVPVPPPAPTEPISEDGHDAENSGKECTGEHQDPWSTGKHEPCCHGLKEKIGQWDGSGRHHFICIDELHGGPTCEEQWNNMACVESEGHQDCFTCGQRISWLESQGIDKKKAKRRVADEFFGECGACDEDKKSLAIETEGYRLVWADEFNSSGPVESSRWESVHSHGNGFGNHELQFYTNRQKNAWISDGTLKIRAVREEFGGRKYTSAKLKTQDAWRYGKFSVRARLQHGDARGTWPAIWLLPQDWKYGSWPHSGEIDIMEHVGYEPGRIHGTVHTGAYHHSIGTQKGGSMHTNVREWHTYTVEWRPEVVIFACDNAVYQVFRKESDDSAVWPFNQDFYLILNMAVGGDWGGVKGVSETAFSGEGQVMEVDWVRVEQRDLNWALSNPTTPTAQIPKSMPSPSTLLPGAQTMTVMSYNTQYTGYPSLVHKFGSKMREVNAGIIGTQECQDAAALASASGYVAVPDTGFQNPIFYNPSKVSLVQGSPGWMKIPRDDYAERTVTWAKFMLGSTEVLFFNTHLPHNHNQARSRNTHARIAKSLLQKRKELGAEDVPTVIVGDMNTFASQGASEGSFASNIVNAGWHKSYEARGDRGGHAGLDQIFASPHWTSSNGADRGTGGSDHTAITVDVTLIG